VAIKTIKRAHIKKKGLLLSLLLMVMFLSACSGSACYVSKTNYADTKLIMPAPPASLEGGTHRGIYLTISKRSSLSIDVECIVDYVQGESTLTGEDASIDHVNPWVYWNWYF
jgi:hypothetical protein